MKLSTLVFCAAFAVAPALIAGPIAYTVTMTGPSEAPPNASPGTGTGLVIFDTTAHTMYLTFSFSGLIGTTTASHIHCCTTVPGAGNVGVATQTPRFVGFPTGFTSGSYTNTYDMTLASSFNPSFITAQGSIAAAEAALAAGAAAGKAYLNIHSTFRPGGEIRGFLAPVPEPATFALGGLALAGIAILRRRHV